MLDLEQVEAMLKNGMEAAREKPGRYGGRYVSRRWDKKQQCDVYEVLDDDDPEKVRDKKRDWDIIAQCLPSKVYGIGGARHWINLDGTVDRKYFEAKP